MATTYSRLIFWRMTTRNASKTIAYLELMFVIPMACSQSFFPVLEQNIWNILYLEFQLYLILTIHTTAAIALMTAVYKNSPTMLYVWLFCEVVISICNFVNVLINRNDSTIAFARKTFMVVLLILISHTLFIIINFIFYCELRREQRVISKENLV